MTPEIEQTVGTPGAAGRNGRPSAPPAEPPTGPLRGAAGREPVGGRVTVAYGHGSYTQTCTLCRQAIDPGSVRAVLRFGGEAHNGCVS